MQEIIIIAGPNGAGKTSFANEFLRQHRKGLEFVNADEIAREMAGGSRPNPMGDVRAAREMLRRLDYLAVTGQGFAFEPTLASLSYAQRIPKWQSAGYAVALIYLKLPSVEVALQRVTRRVAAGGHAIPEGTIRQRFAKSAEYLERLYKPIVDEWYIWESLEGSFRPVEKWDD
ncbi:MAG: AAA family ATPase [Sphingomonadales bacterium]|nr:AAA family ATPase [Sphingomonadales bacterium]